MAEAFTEILEGGLDANAEIVEALANGAIAQWSPVILIAAGTGETLPRVGTTTTANNELVYGVKVGPNKTLAAADIAYICVAGRCKVTVDGAAVLGQTLGTSSTAGKATPLTDIDLAATYNNTTAETQLKKGFHAFGEAMSTASSDGDVIVCDVRRNVGAVT